MNYKKIAKQIVQSVGGSQNIDSVLHCMTRLRFNLKEDSFAETSAIEAMDGVISVVTQAGQYQIVIGNEVSQVYQAIQPLLNQDIEKTSVDTKKMKLFDRFIDTISGIIVPTLPILTSAGILKGILALLMALNLIKETSGLYLFLTITADAFFYFMPIIIGFSVGRKFDANPYTLAILGAVLIHPTFLALFDLNAQGASGLTFLGIPIFAFNYTGSIFPIIIGGWLGAKVEHLVRERLPKSLNLFIPLLVLLASVPLTLLVFAPISMKLSELLAWLTNGILGFSPILAGLVLGGTWQGIVMLGLHWAFIPIMITNISVNGQDPLNAIFICTVFAQTGAAFGVALKTKQPKVKSLGLSCTFSGLFGITEPAIYGITLPYKKPFLMAAIGGALGGVIPATVNARTYSFGGAGIFGIPQLFNPAGLDVSLTTGLISIVVAFVVSMGLTYAIGFNDTMIKEV